MAERSAVVRNLFLLGGRISAVVVAEDDFDWLLLKYVMRSDFDFQSCAVTKRNKI
jgi:hypothetical protein